MSGKTYASPLRGLRCCETPLHLSHLDICRAHSVGVIEVWCRSPGSNLGVASPSRGHVAIVTFFGVAARSAGYADASIKICGGHEGFGR